MGSVVSAVAGIFKESPAEKARKRAKKEAEARAGRAAEVTEQEKGKAAAQLAIFSGSPQGVLGDTPTGRRKLLGN
jgi:hypothetical protein